MSEKKKDNGNMLPILNWCDIQWGLKCVTHMKEAHYWTKWGHSTHKEYYIANFVLLIIANQW